ncbi:flagellar basal-body rod modification protein FlgD [Allopseudospirillum japonicum]|uniref:Basal-body rod modification protein FlgD n=1 Tax=Allopseudospirillum japonicum TaxID=64971 RepID=A0A1H6TI66_9GAMM|nr:flagellar hook assembly protein FlgD [Allopseudospirillum japonicum]SEI77884.1 flagellar basal-body rod modification protein FlgD [Allopseudospirillum japonicum]
MSIGTDNTAGDAMSRLAIGQRVDASKGDKTRNEMGKNEFLELMIAQMENQDPLQPQGNTEFIAQLAQFSSLEGMQNLNETVNQFGDMMRASQVVQASTMIGRDVQVQGDTAYFTAQKPVAGTIELPSSTSNLLMKVYNQAGELVDSSSLGSHEAGDVPFNWVGVDETGEELMPAGFYRFEVTAEQDGEQTALTTYLGAQVGSVTMGSGANANDIMLNVVGLDEPVALSSVKAIN